MILKKYNTFRLLENFEEDGIIEVLKDFYVIPDVVWGAIYFSHIRLDECVWTFDGFKYDI